MNQVNRLFSAKVEQYQNLLAEKKAAVGLESSSFKQLLTRQLPQAGPGQASPGLERDELAAPAPVKAEPVHVPQIKLETVLADPDYKGLIRQAATAFDLDPALIQAVIQVESRFKPEAVSRAGAMGLMQLMPATAKSLAVSDPFDPGQNITAGANVLRQHLDRFSDLRLALAAYNAGPGRIGGLAVQDPDDPAEYAKISPAVRDYVAKVLDYYDQYSQDQLGEG